MRILLCLLAAAFLLGTGSGCSAKARSARHLQRGDKYFAAGDYSKAEIEYLVALKRDPASARAISQLGTIYYEQGRLSRAVPFVAKAVELSTNDIESHYKLASIYQMAGKTKEARRELDLVLKRMPRHKEAPILLAESVSSKKELDEVRQRIETFKSQIGDSAALQIAFGALFFRQGDTKTAEAAFRRALELEPQSAGAYNALGSLLWAQEDIKGADSAFKAAAGLSPVRSAIRLRYADFEIRTGNLTEGTNLLAQMTKDAPDFLPAWVRQAGIALAQNRLEDCQSLLNQVLTRDPENYDALLMSGRLSLSRKEGSKAVLTFEQLSKLYPRSPEVNFHLALSYLLNQETSKAAKSVNQALILNPSYTEAILLQAQLNVARDDVADAIASLTDLLKRQPKLAQAHLQLAAAYRTKGDLDSALTVYRRLEEQYPKSLEAPLLMGQLYAQQNRMDLARKAFLKVLELSPDYLPAVEYLVDLDLSDKSFDAALARIQQEAARQSKVPEISRAPVLELLRAKVYAAQKDNTRAEAALLKAIEEDPASQTPYFLLAQLYVETKQTDKALARLDEALVRRPKDVASLMLKASIQDEAKDYNDARETYERLVAVSPDYYPGLNNLAYLYSERFNQLEKAFEMARKARDLLAFSAKSAQDSQQASVAKLRAFSSDTLGWIVFKRGDYTWALSLLQESAEQLGDEPEVQFHLGMAYYMAGQEERAANALKRALSFNKEFPGKTNAVRRLAILAIDGKTAGPEATASLEAELKQHPDDPAVLVRLGEVFERDGHLDKVLVLYEAALKEKTKNVAILTKLTRLYAGPFHDVSKALQYAKDAYKLAPEDPEVASSLGQVAFQAGDYKWALSLLEQASGKQMLGPELLYELAMAYYSAGRLAEAQATMQSALDARGAFPQVADAHRFMELAPCSPSDALRFEAKAREVLKTSPEDVPALMIAAQCSQQKGDASAARQSYERVLSRYPDFSPAWKPLAALYLDAGDSTKAYELAIKARTVFPADPLVARTLGIAEYQRSDYKNAVRLLQECIQQNAADGVTFYYLGMAHFQAKELKESKVALQKALALNLQPKLTQQAKQVLAKLN